MKPSLTRRLLVLFVATVLLALGLAGSLAWVMMRRALYAGLDEALRAEAVALAGRLEADEGRVEFEPSFTVAESSGETASLLHIVTSDGRKVFSSPALKPNRAILDQRVSAALVGDGPFWFTAALTSDAARHRVVAQGARVGPDAEAREAGAADQSFDVWVLVARPLAGVDQTLGQLAAVLGLAVGVSVLVTLVGGRFVARRGAQPVRVLAETVGRAQPGDAGLSLERSRVPVELEPIVETTERLLARVRDELSRQRQLTADVAHDLRTPVAGVRTLLDVCLQRERGSAEYVSVIEKARAAMRQLSRLLDDVLTLSRIETGVDQPVWADASFEEVVGAAVATAGPLAAAREVTIQVERHPDRGLRTDRIKLVKILSNLLSNAVEHSPPGGTVRLAAQVENGQVKFAITDQGPGIPAELRERIFDRFVRGDAARAGADGHQGLGLPIAAGLARAMGGEVTLESQGEPGSRFVVLIPI